MLLSITEASISTNLASEYVVGGKGAKPDVQSTKPDAF